MEKEQEQENKKKQNFRKEVRSWIVCIAATLAITLFITNFVIVNASIPSGSMENTIMTGDKLIAFRTAYLFSEPERGDVIIFEYPDDESEWYIKRVIALPGETIEVKDGKAEATIIWSSSNYDYMRVDEEKFLPVNTEGNSTFVITVTGFDSPLTVYADTTAMSTPHEIEYTLTFDSSTLEEQKQ